MRDDRHRALSTESKVLPAPRGKLRAMGSDLDSVSEDAANGIRCLDKELGSVTTTSVHRCCRQHAALCLAAALLSLLVPARGEQTRDLPTTRNVFHFLERRFL